jgi:hypothetical protein
MRLFAQSAPGSLYAESFRQGPTRISEERFELKLTPQDPVFRERIKDSHGAECYALSFTPIGPEHLSNITSWQVILADLHHKIYDNVLLTSQAQPDDPNNDPNNNPEIDPRDLLRRLNPSNFSRVPLSAKRIIKVESFYVVLQVKAHHFTPSDSPYLDSMTVAVELTNTDPRVAEASQK